MGGFTMLSEVLKTLLTQLYALNSRWKKDYKVKQLLIVDDKTLRIHSELNEVFVNIDIRYNEVLDLYEVTAHRGLKDEIFDEALMALGDFLAVDWNDPKFEKIKPLLQKIHDLLFGMDKIAEYKDVNGVTWEELDEVIKAILWKADKDLKTELLNLKMDCYSNS